jgi:hypothetical protein
MAFLLCASMPDRASIASVCCCASESPSRAPAFGASGGHIQFAMRRKTCAAQVRNDAERSGSVEW